MTSSSHPLLSVVIPTHDVRPWIRQTLDSVLRQRGDDMEVIVVDDRSTDGTAAFARTYAERDPRVTVIASPTPGGGSARNAGAERARGRYLVFADGDDLIPDGAYTALVESLEASGSDVAIGDYLKFRAVDTWRPTAAMPAFQRPARGVTLADEPTLLYSRPCWNKAYRTDFWREAGIAFPDVPRSNDIVPMVRSYLAARAIDVVEDVVYVYRERPGAGSMTAQAGAATSLVSYLTQETACAELVAASGDEALRAVHANLVWDRDGYVAVAKHLAAWTEATDGDAEVEAALRGLLAATAEPGAQTAPLKRLAIELAARGSFAAAHLVAQIERGHVDASADGGLVVSSWRALLAEPDLADLPQEAREILVERLSRQLTHARPSGSAWRAVLGEARAELGERVALFAPDAFADPSGDARRDALRAELAGRVDAIAGGHLLAIEGVSARRDGVTPALFDGEAAIAAGEPRLLEPASVTWTEAADGTWRWAIAYTTPLVPLHRPLTPVLVAGGDVVPVLGAPELPPYTPRDGFLYDVVDGVPVIRRRRHWAPRAARRGAIVAIERLRSATRR
ncbi:glycosyltransferase family 2 protein [Microbacterium indicum]|uniref:glycosyltransferase family 2 protein n=1 Tax=Microbacterium indicum TaxID=358100 RepID=UPI000422DD21|nr:glycosyltransferase family 2 protein [Microbacterium indicum]